MSASCKWPQHLPVTAPLVASVAAALLTGCHRPEMQRCVDEHNHIVDQHFCQNLPPQNAGYGGGFGGPAYIPMYRYYYGGGGGWNLGEPVYGGSYSSLSGHSYTTSSSAAHVISSGGSLSDGAGGTTRGGFGGTHGGGSGSASSSAGS